MQRFVDWLVNLWPFKLLGLIVVLGSFGAYVYKLVLYHRLFQAAIPEPPAMPPVGDGIVALRKRHTDSPKSFGFLKGKTIKANGLIMRKDMSAASGTPTVELKPYPFSIDADITCLFAPEDARRVYKLGFVQLVSIIGVAKNGIEIGSEREGFTHKLVLTDCTVRRPSFGIWLRRQWSDLWFIWRMGL